MSLNSECVRLSHRLLHGGVISLRLLSRQTSDAMPILIQLLEQDLLMTQSIGKQLLVQLAYRWFVALKQYPRFQLLPPRPDYRADREQLQLARSDQTH